MSFFFLFFFLAALPSTFGVFVEVSDVLPDVAAHALRADLLAHKRRGVDLGCAAVLLPHHGVDIGVHLGEDKRGVVLEEQLPLFDGLHRDRTTAVHP